MKTKRTISLIIVLVVILAMTSVSAFGFGNHGHKGVCPELDKPDTVVVPAPGAIILCSIGATCVSFFRRRKMI